jgi:hypothetical protein
VLEVSSQSLVDDEHDVDEHDDDNDDDDKHDDNNDDDNDDAGPGCIPSCEIVCSSHWNLSRHASRRCPHQHFQVTQ